MLHHQPGKLEHFAINNTHSFCTKASPLHRSEAIQEAGHERCIAQKLHRVGAARPAVHSDCSFSGDREGRCLCCWSVSGCQKARRAGDGDFGALKFLVRDAHVSSWRRV